MVMFSCRWLAFGAITIIIPEVQTQILPRRLSFREQTLSEWYTPEGSLSKSAFHLRSMGSEDAQIGPWGFNLTGRDLSVQPGDDFYAHAVGNYLKSLEIPSDRTGYGSFDALAEKAELAVKEIIEADTGKVGNYYKAFMDRDKIEELGLKPLKPLFKEIKVALTPNSLARLSGKGCESFYFSPYGVYVGQDAGNPDQNVVHIVQDGLGLPIRDYYLKAEHQKKKDLYEGFVLATLKRLNWERPERYSKEIVEFETKIAEVSWSPSDLRDAVKTYSPITLDDLKKEANGFDWTAFLTAAKVDLKKPLVLQGRSAIVNISKVWSATAKRYEGKLMLHAWQAFHVTMATSSVLPKEFVDAAFEFQKSLTGARQLPDAWKRAVRQTNKALGEAVGKLYVNKHFPPASKKKMDDMVAGLLATHKENIDGLTWMSPETKTKALNKLSKLRTKIGHPKVFKDYSGLEAKSDDAFGNYLSAAKFHWQDELQELGKGVDKDKWFMSPQTVNAYYMQTMNEIVFPAAILQPPFFDVAADAAVNYGGIGAVIGHEITHGFDDQGRRYDETGKLKDWWTAEDETRFNALAERLGKQYSKFEPFQGSGKINAELTMGENIADNGGLRMALQAYHKSLGESQAPELDALSGDQRFFLSWAQVWAANVRPEMAKQALLTDPHSPPKARGSLPQCNMAPWYTAFDVKEGSKMYIAPEDRVEIWYHSSAPDPVWPAPTPSPPVDPVDPDPHQDSGSSSSFYVGFAIVAILVTACLVYYFRCRKKTQRAGPDMEIGGGSFENAQQLVEAS